MSSAGFYAVWAVLGAAALALWALAQRSPTVARPSEVVGRMARSPLWRVVLVFVLMFAGWHFFAR